MTTTRWFDAKTRMPLREQSLDGNGQTVAARYWTYEIERQTLGELAGDFFRVPDPPTMEQEKRVTFYGAASPGPQTDPDTGTSYRAFGLGLAPTIAGAAFCLTNTMKSTLREDVLDPIERTETGDLAPDPIAASSSRFLATYSVLTGGQSCVPGLPALDDPDLIVRTTPKASVMASAWKHAYQAAGELIQGNPLDADFLRGGLQPILLHDVLSNALLMPLDVDQDGLYFELGDLAVVITGPFGRLNAQGIIDSLITL